MKINLNGVISSLTTSGQVSPDEIEALDTFRLIRNQIIHATGVGEWKARELLDLSERIVMQLSEDRPPSDPV